jgi:hypothetical protein
MKRDYMVTFGRGFHEGDLAIFAVQVEMAIRAPNYVKYLVVSHRAF